MKTALVLITILGLSTFGVVEQSQIGHEDLKTTCKVLYQLSNNAIDRDRKDLIAIYYNAYKAIRLSNEITNGCDQYFDEIRTNYSEEIGNWALGLDFPPKQFTSPSTPGFTHKEMEVFFKLRELNLTFEDLEQLMLYKGIQENTVDLRLLKITNAEKIIKLNENLNKMKIESIDYSKLNSLSNDKIDVELLQKVIND